MAQWIRHLTTNQGIPGSSPGRVVKLFFVPCLRCYGYLVSFPLVLIIQESLDRLFMGRQLQLPNEKKKSYTQFLKVL